MSIGEDGRIDVKIVVDTTDVQKTQQQIEQLKKTLSDNRQTNGGLFNNSGVLSYQQQLANLNKLAEKHWQQWKLTGDEINKVKFDGVNVAMEKVRANFADFKAQTHTATMAVDSFSDAWKRHARWIATGLSAFSIAGGVGSMVSTLSEIEQEFNQLKTVLPELHDNQATYNQAVSDAFALAERYGTKIKDVTESLRLMGRGYRELSTSEKLAENALKLSVADNFSPETATKVIEGLVGAYGKQANAVEFSTKIMDSMTKVSHTAQISADDLAKSLMRSAAAAHTVGVGFDELTAMTAVMARNTGLSGETLGDGLKSVLNTIHSSKAIKEIEAFGVDVYKIGEDGTKSFRNISDVLVDIGIKAKSTNANIEKLLLSMSGKYQVSKLSALIGDPNEYLRVLGSSINSSGFTDRQIEVQMNTLAKKAETLKASFQELLVVGGGQSGFADSLKGILDSLNMILKGLNSINPVVYTTLGYLAKGATVIYASRVGINALAVSYDLLKTSLLRTTVAQEGLNVATAASPWGAVLKLAGVAAGLLATYAYYTGEAATAQEKLAQKTENQITAQESQVQMVKTQVGFVETLANAYVETQAALEQEGLTEEKSAELKKTSATISEQLAQTVGKAAADRILSSDNIKAAVTDEQKVLSDKAATMEESLSNLKKVQEKLSIDTINASNERINAINNEADSMDKACDAIAEALGRIDSIMMRHYRNKGNYLNNLADGGIKDEWKIAGIQVGDQQDISQVTEQIKKEADEANAKADEIKDRALNYYVEKSRKALGTIYTPTGSTVTVPSTTGTVGDSGNTGGNGNSGKSGESKAASLDRLLDNHATSVLLQSVKDSAKKYKDALDEINDTEARFGVTTETTASKLELMKARLSEVTAERLKMANQQASYNEAAEKLAMSSEELTADLKAKGLEWQQLSDEEKSSFASFYKDSIADEKQLVYLLQQAVKLKGQLQDNENAGNGLKRDIPKTEVSGIKGAYQQSATMRGYDTSIEQERLSQQDANDDLVRKAKLKAALVELGEAQQEYNKLVEAKAPASELKKQELVVEQLKTKVHELANNDVRKLQEAYADMVSELVVDGKKFSDIWGDLWKDLEREAIKRLFHVKTEMSTLSMIASGGKGKSGSAAVSTPSSSLGTYGSGAGTFGGYTLKPYANGGVTDEPSLAGEDGEEVVIPVEKNKQNSPALLSYASHKLGISPTGGEYVPYFKNQALASKPMVNVNLSTEAQVRKQEETNRLLVQQNNLLLNASQGGNTTIVTTAVSSEQVLQVLQQNPQALQNILGRNKSNGWR